MNSIIRNRGPFKFILKSPYLVMVVILNLNLLLIPLLLTWTLGLSTRTNLGSWLEDLGLLDCLYMWRHTKMMRHRLVGTN